MGKTWRHIIFIFFLVLILAPFSWALADEGRGVVFNEIAWAGSSVSTADEWVELYNDSAEIVDLSGWQIQNLVTGKTMVTIQSGQIVPFGYFLIANNSKDHSFSGGESMLNIDPDVIESDISLSNDKFQLELLDKDNISIDIAGDTADSGGKPSWGGEKDGIFYSMVRNMPISDGSSWKQASEQKNLDSFEHDIASPENSGAPKIIFAKIADKRYQIGDNLRFALDFKVLDSRDDLDKIEIDLTNGASVLSHLETNIDNNLFESPPLDFCPKIKIIFTDKTGLKTMAEDSFVCVPRSLNVGFSEVLPHPKALDYNGDGLSDLNDEWFEITNYSQEGIDLENWIVEAPGEPPYVIDEVYLKYGESKVFYKSQTGISLNDSGDSLVLKNPFGETVDSVLIPSSSSKYNVSYNKWGDAWQWSTKSTPRQINEIVTLTFSVGGAVTEVEKATFTVETASGPVRMSNNPSYSPNLGDKITSRGQLYLEDNTYFALNFKVTPKNIPKPDSSIPLAINEKENAGSLGIIKRSTKKIKFPSQKLKHLGLKQLNMDYKASKISASMVYLFSLFTVISVIFIYEICCRE